jgi:hypothetical protein
MPRLHVTKHNRRDEPGIVYVMPSMIYTQIGRQFSAVTVDHGLVLSKEEQADLWGILSYIALVNAA